MNASAEQPITTEPGTKIEYTRIHYHARKHMGTACETCGSTEQLQAALHPRTPASRLRATEAGVPYSLDPADYHALCFKCHVELDASLRNGQPPNHCKRGHELTPENTYINSSSRERACRECIRDKQRRYEAKQRAHLAGISVVPPRHPVAPGGSDTRCPEGHDLTPENTAFTKQGFPRCVTCRRAYARDYARARRAAVKAARQRAEP